jgi:SpoIIAA-like
MLELIKELPDNVVGILARGHVTSEECNDVLRPAMEVSLKRHDKLRLYYEIGSRFPGAGWDDLQIAIDNLPQWERIAIVTDTGWVRHTVNALQFLLPSEVKVFTSWESEAGRAWIAGPSGVCQRAAAAPPPPVRRRRRTPLTSPTRSRRLAGRSAPRDLRRRQSRS